MASQTVTYRARNLVGNLREDFGTYTTSDTDGEVRTRLTWLYAVMVTSLGVGTGAAEVYLNTVTTTEDDAASGGVFHFAGATASTSMIYRAIGK